MHQEQYAKSNPVDPDAPDDVAGELRRLEYMRRVGALGQRSWEHAVLRVLSAASDDPPLCTCIVSDVDTACAIHNPLPDRVRADAVAVHDLNTLIRQFVAAGHAIIDSAWGGFDDGTAGRKLVAALARAAELGYRP